jgi:hypothetical protein
VGVAKKDAILMEQLILSAPGAAEEVQRNNANGTEMDPKEVAYILLYESLGVPSCVVADYIEWLYGEKAAEAVRIPQ